MAYQDPCRILAGSWQILKDPARILIGSCPYRILAGSLRILKDPKGSCKDSHQGQHWFETRKLVIVRAWPAKMESILGQHNVWYIYWDWVIYFQRASILYRSHLGEFLSWPNASAAMLYLSKVHVFWIIRFHTSHWLFSPQKPFCSSPIPLGVRYFLVLT